MKAKIDIFPQTEVTVSEGAFGLIKLEGENGTIYFNGNGIWKRMQGNLIDKVSLKEAKKVLGLFVELEKMED